MSSFKRNLLIGACATLTLSGAANALVINVSTWIAPNASGSASFAGAQTNAITALRAGATSAGTPGTPEYYQQRSNVNRSELIVTNFNSWKGDATPDAPFQNEFGSRGHFALVIDGQGQQFDIANLSFVATSNDAANSLGFAFPDGYEYGAGYVGVRVGADGVLGTADDTEVTSGTGLVDYLFSRGSGGAAEVLCGTTPTTPCGAGNQSYLDAAIADPLFPTQYVGTYSLVGSGVSGSATFNINADAVPEPATWLTMVAGFGLAGGALRRRRVGAVAV